MDRAAQIILLIKLILGGLSVFLAIIIWSKTVNIEWFFLLLAIVAFYIDIILNTLYFFGLFSYPELSIGGINIVVLSLEIFPLLFVFTGFFIKAVKERNR